MTQPPQTSDPTCSGSPDHGPPAASQCPPAPCCRRGCESICHLQNSLGGESPKSSKGVPRSGGTSKNKHAHDPSASRRHVMHRPILVTGYTPGPLPVLLSCLECHSHTFLHGPCPHFIQVSIWRPSSSRQAIAPPSLSVFISHLSLIHHITYIFIREERIPI